jgi:hypothetical protein
VREKTILGPSGLEQFFLSQNEQFSDFLLYIKSTLDNRAYTPTTFSKDEIPQNHVSVLNAHNIPGHFDDDSELL